MLSSKSLRWFLSGLPCLLVGVLPAAEPVQFNRDIRGLLFDRCVACHGPDEKHRQADLRFDQEEAAKEWAIVPGDAEGSELISRITSDDPDMKMPPPESGKTLTEEEVALLRRWIDEGAAWQPHWAFIPPDHPQPPEVKDSSWVRNDIDRFVLARLEAEGLSPSPPAPKEMLLRRVTFDITGLPPTLEELDAFLNDHSPDAYEKVVDRLLNSPHYGEQMAVEWLQAARYADSNGYQNDFRREQWPWRDWVINAFNSNMPFDQFTVEQTAGDLLPNAGREQIVATGFHRNNRTVTEAGSINDEWRVENNVDRVETTAAVFLGLTMGCCRCHDHKYDPITQKDFYSFFAFFDNIDEQGVYTETRGNVPPLLTLDTPENKERLADFDRQIASAQKVVDEELDRSVADFAASVQERAAQKAELIPRVLVSFDGDLAVSETDPVTLESTSLTPSASESEAGVVARYTGENPKFEEGLVGHAIVLKNKPESHVELGQSIQPERDTPFSWSLWIRPDANNAALISRMDDPQGFRGWDTLLLADGKLKVHLIHQWPDNALAAVTKEKIPTGQWSQICVSYDGSGKAAGIAVWQNGRRLETEVDKDNLSGTIVVDQPVRLGRRSTELYFKGALSRFKWFDRILNDDEVAQGIAEDLTATGSFDPTGWPEARQKLLREFVLNSRPAGLAEHQASLAKLKEERTAYEKAIPTVMTLKDVEKHRETYVLTRGAYDAPDKSQRVYPDVPGILPPLAEEEWHDRLDLAKWLVDPANPLVSRVTVNRLWMRYFGRGIVKSVDNFGVQCDPPTHPELLDWLATEFMSSGWDLKGLQKMIVMSATYQQTSNATPEAIKRDPENSLLARGPRQRLSAEQIRDNALAISGLLTRHIGGPSVKPYQPPGLWEELAGGANEGPYVQSTGADLYRRSLYTNRKRTVPHTTMSTFDAPSFEICTVKRAITNTPLQSLALLNDVTYVEAARKLAERMILEGGSQPRERIGYGFRLATMRWPTAEESDALGAALDGYLQVFAADQAAAEEVLRHGDSPVNESIPKPELAAYAVLGSVLLNLDETVCKP